MGAYIQRFEMPDTRINIPRMTAQSISRPGEGTFVQFAGRALPVGARPNRIPPKVWDIEIPLAKSEHALANDISWLLEQAFVSSDARIEFIPDDTKDDGVHPNTVVEVHNWDMGREPGGIVRFRFQAQEVDS